MNARPRAKSWPRGPLNAEHNCVGSHMLSFELCIRTAEKRQNWYDLAVYTSETTGVQRQSSTAVRRLYTSFVQTEDFITRKRYFCYRDTTQQYIFCHRLSDYLHCTNRPFTHALRKDMSIHSLTDQNVYRLEKMFSTLAKYHAKAIWTVLNHWGFAMGALQSLHLLTVPWSSGKHRFVLFKSDILTITTSTSQLIVTSAYYAVIAKALIAKNT